MLTTDLISDIQTKNTAKKEQICRLMSGFSDSLLQRSVASVQHVPAVCLSHSEGIFCLFSCLLVLAECSLLLCMLDDLLLHVEAFAAADSIHVF